MEISASLFIVFLVLLMAGFISAFLRALDQGPWDARLLARDDDFHEDKHVERKARQRK
ncbi:MAG: hypothetical protein ACI4NA_03665 [Succinivibrio sp.]